jgi:hypothetical protein
MFGKTAWYDERGETAKSDRFKGGSPKLFPT